MPAHAHASCELKRVRRRNPRTAFCRPRNRTKYSYDAAGNATADGVATFGYDGAGRMTSATASGVTAGYALNALGQRVRKTVNGVTTVFVYDESGHLLGEYEASGALIREYVWLGDIPVAVITGGPGTPPYVFWYLHTDHLNTPRAVENPTTGELMWRWDSAPFGETAPDEDPDGDLTAFILPLRFPGQYADQETGLHYNYFRDYEPRTGRYIESDPIGLDGGINTYAYVGSNPLAKSDLTGLAPGPQTLPSGKCAREIANATFAKAKREGWVRLDKRLHCVVSCEIMRKCGLSYAFAAGWIRELNQLIVQGDLFDQGRRRDSAKDAEANERGRGCPVKENCLTWCSQEY